MGQEGKSAVAGTDAEASASFLRKGEALASALDEVMDRYARGEDDALDDLYRRAAPRLRAFLARLCGSLALADDLTQDAFLRICAARGSFVAGASTLPWMYAIARNALRDHARREHVRRSYRDSHAHRDTSGPSVGAGESTAMAREALGAVHEALMNVPVRQREAFVLLRFEGLTLVEAAEVLGTTPGAVKILVFRAYKAVRAALDKEGAADSPAARPR
jgi:RNA polymerase sigma-70 factor (ECF subfamily)